MENQITITLNELIAYARKKIPILNHSSNSAIKIAIHIYDDDVHFDWYVYDATVEKWIMKDSLCTESFQDLNDLINTKESDLIEIDERIYKRITNP